MTSLLIFSLFLFDQKIAEVSNKTPGAFDYDAIQTLCQVLHHLPAEELPENMQKLNEAYNSMSRIIMKATKDGTLDEGSAGLMFYNVNGFFLSDAFRATKQFENQISVLELALRYAKNTSWERHVLEELGYAHLYLGEIEMGISYFEQILKLPKPIRKHYARQTGVIRKLASLYQKNGNAYEAMKCYELSFKKIKEYGAEVREFHKKDLETYLNLRKDFGYESDDAELEDFMHDFVSRGKGVRVGFQKDDKKTIEKSQRHDTKMLARNFRKVHNR